MIWLSVSSVLSSQTVEPYRLYNYVVYANCRKYRNPTFVVYTQIVEIYKTPNNYMYVKQIA